MWHKKLITLTQTEGRRFLRILIGCLPILILPVFINNLIRMMISFESGRLLPLLITGLPFVYNIIIHTLDNFPSNP